MAGATGSAIVLPIEGRPSGGIYEQLMLPGVDIYGLTTLTITANRLYYTPIYLSRQLTVSAFYIRVTGAAVNGAIRVGIYKADKNWQPESLVVDAGAIDTSSTGTKSVSLSPEQILQPGRYLIAQVFNNSTNDIQIYRATARYAGFAASDLTFTQTMYVSYTYSTLPTTPLKWDTIDIGSTAMLYFTLLKISYTQE